MSENDKPESAEIERGQPSVLRGRIIRTLGRDWDTPRNSLGFEVIWHTVDKKAWTEAEIRSALTYLLNAGYIAEDKDTVVFPGMDQPVISYRIAAKGKQLLRGEFEDNGIEVEAHD